jgi:CarD family transcriptional regulator
MNKYLVGQKVMHPLHGIGTVETIEEKSILGKTNKFSVINFTTDRLKIMVNLDQKSMIRGLISEDDVQKVFESFKKCTDESCIPARSSERFNLNMKKIKSSDIFQMAEVIRDLSELNKKKKLSRKEQTLLKQAKKIFCSEVSYVNNISPEEAEALVDQKVEEALIDVVPA